MEKKLVTLQEGDFEGLGETARHVGTRGGTSQCQGVNTSTAERQKLQGQGSSGEDELFCRVDKKTGVVWKSLGVPAPGIRSGRWVQVPHSRAWSQSRG